MAKVFDRIGWFCVGLFVAFKIAVLGAFAFEKMTGRAPSFSLVTPARAASLDGASTGADWRAASRDERTRWAVTAATVIEPEKLAAAVLAVGIIRSLDEAVTSRSDEEDLAVEMIKGQGLAEMTAFCVIFIQTDE